LGLINFGCLGIGEHTGTGLSFDEHGDAGHLGWGHPTGQLGHVKQSIAESAIVDEEA
jgi:hypothetical protein